MTEDVTIQFEGVREEQLPRLETAVKTHLVRFGRKVTVTHKPEKAVARLARKAKVTLKPAKEQ